ncbi:MAG: metal ABC transporter substrate-binding protein [Tabrizicola sp.]
MITRRLLLASAAALAFAAPAFAQERLNVIATFSILGDIVANVGGDRVKVTTLVGPDGDAHVFQPAPADAQAVASAKVVFVNGLGFEGWMDRLIASAEYNGPVVVASEGVTPRTFDDDAHDAGQEGHDHEHGTDPHAWQSVANAEIYTRNIAAGLAAADPAGAATYEANSAAYLAELATLDAEVKAAIAALPEDRRTIVTSHDAFGYFGAAYGMIFKAPQGISTESEASAADVAALITQIREDKIPAVFMEDISDPRLLDQIAAETGAKIGGTLYSDALSPADGPAATYLTMMRHNIGEFTAALSQ